MADLLDQKRYLYDRLFGSDFEDEPLPSPLIQDDSLRVVEPAVVVDLKQQTEQRERCILRLRVRKIPGTNLYQNLSYKNQDDVIQAPKIEAAKRKYCDELRQEKVGNRSVKPKQVSKCAKKNHGDSVRARIEWKSRHLAVRKSKYLSVHKPNLLMAF